MGSSDMVFRWRKASHSGGNGSCVELGRAGDPVATWRKSSRSGHNGSCVELASAGAVRDSKNPTGPILRADLTALLTAVKSDRI
jgi:hypothetical protein